MERYVKPTFASLLLIMLLALGGLAANASLKDGGVATLLSPAKVAGQKIEAKPVAATATTPATPASFATRTCA